MKSPQHPSFYLDEESIEQIRESAGEAEGARRLHDRQLEIIYRNKWLKMYVPKKYGGLDLSLPEILRIEECISWTDGSAGWVVTLCSGAGWFIGFLDPHIADTIFNDEKVCIAGSGALTGVAEITETGYELRGSWKYASGAVHATAFTMNCLIFKNGHQIYNDDGTPKTSSFILTKDEVTLHKTWNAMGMMATGSHSFEVNHLPVSQNRSFIIDPSQAVLQNSIYQYPFLQLAETTLAVNISGMAVRFIDLCEGILSNKAAENQPQRKSLMKVAMDVRTKLDECRHLVFVEVEKSWNILLTKNKIPDAMSIKISEACHTLVQNCRESVNLLYPYCGLRAAATDSEINRVWRNIHTAGQHALFNNMGTS